MTMRRSLPDTSCCEVPLVASDDWGLRWFFLLGWLDQSVALAEWGDGRLRVSQHLFDMALLATRLDRIFADAGHCEPGHCASLIKSPGHALVTLAEACDGIYAMETIDENGRRSWP